jgi:hypothetical protein
MARSDCLPRMKDRTPAESSSDALSPDQKPSVEGAPASASLSHPEQWVELHGDYLFSYALMRPRDTTKAEDAVQETFLAALKGGKSFAGRSAEKSWLVGILKTRFPIITAKSAVRLHSRTWSFTRTKRVTALSRTACSKTVGFTNLVRKTGQILAPVWTARCFGRLFAIARTSCQRTSGLCSLYGRLTASRAGRFAPC